VVNAASGLEAETKKVGCSLIASEVVADAAGIETGRPAVYRGGKHPAHDEFAIRLMDAAEIIAAVSPSAD